MLFRSLLAMQNTGADPQVLRRLEESQNRIRTIALIHEQLYQSTEVSKIDIRSYLNVLATHLLQSFGMSERVALIQDVENVDFDIDQCLACGLIVNELLTNAMKYAFPDNRRGMIRLTLRQHSDGSKLLEVRDDGQGLPPPDAARPSRKTLGTSLIAKLARQLKGKVDEVDAALDEVCEIAHRRHDSIGERGHVANVCTFCSIGHLHRFGVIHRDRLLAENMLAVRDRSERDRRIAKTTVHWT